MQLLKAKQKHCLHGTHGNILHWKTHSTRPRLWIHEHSPWVQIWKRSSNLCLGPIRTAKEKNILSFGLIPPSLPSLAATGTYWNRIQHLCENLVQSWETQLGFIWKSHQSQSLDFETKSWWFDGNFLWEVVISGPGLRFLGPWWWCSRLPRCVQGEMRQLKRPESRESWEFEVPICTKRHPNDIQTTSKRHPNDIQWPTIQMQLRQYLLLATCQYLDKFRSVIQLHRLLHTCSFEQKCWQLLGKKEWVDYFNSFLNRLSG